MLLLIIYLAIGVLNYAHFTVKNMSYVFQGPTRGGISWLFELGFFVLLWPLQALYLVIVGINVATSYILGRFMG